MSGEVLVWKNYRPVKNSESCLSVFERGLQYGDGFFTTALIQDSHLQNWSAHQQRLQMSAKRLGFPELDYEKLELSLREQFSAYAQIYAQVSTQNDCVCKIMVTRGVGGRGYLPPEIPEVQVFSVLMPAPKFKQQLCRAQISPVIVEISPDLSGIKHLNRLGNVLARQNMDLGFDEAIMFNAFGQVQCATQSNVFVIKNHQILTPKVNLGGVAGTARSCLLTQAKEQVLMIEDILEADSLFFTNAVRGVQIVETLDLSNWEYLQRKFSHLGLSQLQDLPAGKFLSESVSSIENTVMKTFKPQSPLLEKLQQMFLHQQHQTALKLN